MELNKYKQVDVIFCPSESKPNTNICTGAPPHNSHHFFRFILFIRRLEASISNGHLSQLQINNP